MRKMTCKQLGGACDLVFIGETFEEIANQSKKHGNEMIQKGDAAKYLFVQLDRKYHALGFAKHIFVRTAQSVTVALLHNRLIHLIARD